MYRFVFVLILWCVSAIPVLACTCSDPSLSEHFRDVDLVFEGKVISSELLRKNSSIFTPGTASYSSARDPSVNATVFEVTRPLKGRAMSTRTIVHSVPSVRGIERYESGDYKKYWPDQWTSAQKQRYEDTARESYDFALKLVSAEGDFIRRLKSEWPSMQFSDACQVHFQ